MQSWVDRHRITSALVVFVFILITPIIIRGTKPTNLSQTPGIPQTVPIQVSVQSQPVPTARTTTSMLPSTPPAPAYSQSTAAEPAFSSCSSTSQSIDDGMYQQDIKVYDDFYSNSVVGLDPSQPFDASLIQQVIQNYNNYMKKSYTNYLAISSKWGCRVQLDAPTYK